MNKLKVGFVGIGLMGLPMVKNIAKHNCMYSVRCATAAWPGSRPIRFQKAAGASLEQPVRL